MAAGQGRGVVWVGEAFLFVFFFLQEIFGVFRQDYDIIFPFRL